ncbi:arginyl-tRNA synthetase [Candidatus Phytoplasma luffae]|uniref:Arginine--tRNA ligase n=1 Tax=Loofah witches'-broom phytoplasma TaxID=35773 RepID=A0A975FIX3_LOWBP|nr:arginine--tRNA ligase [Candidatus Phytoplasma luffae]QTX02769.1 arginyl-tRNA synthetase [Candidatus Phytoplasma luffae]
MYLQQTKEQLEKILNDKYNIPFFFQYNYKSEDIDFFLPLFVYNQKFKKSLLNIFEDFKKEIIKNSSIENIFFCKGFLNIKLNRKIAIKNIFLNIGNFDNYIKKKNNHNKVIVLDYSSPNIAKNFSIGHLRSTVIGNALKNVYQKLGFTTVSINHLGDWGTQFGKMILAYKKWIKKENLNIDPLTELQRVYVLFHQEAEKNKKLEEEARNIFRLLETKDKEIINLWQWLTDVSLKEFKKIYDLLGVHFDHYIGESFFHDKAIQLLDDLHKKNEIVLDNGAYIIPLDNDLPPALMQKNNKSTLYLTRDVACAIYRYQRFAFHKCLYIVGNEQKLHYQQLKLVLKKIGYDNINLEHINFGLVLFENTKISTRENIEFKLIDIIEKTKKEVKKIIQKRHLDEEKIEQISQKVAIGAIVFNDLKNDRHLNIDFDLQKMLKFEGNTGPYFQYTVVRFRSILLKVDINNTIDLDKIIDYYVGVEYYKLIRLIDSFSVVLEKVQEQNMPSVLSRYLFQLAKSANKFYEKEKILHADNSLLQYANILLIKNFLNIFEEGMSILGIPVLEQM